MRTALALCGLALTLASGCGTNASHSIPSAGDSYTFLALGDSYTIGQSVAPDESFPVQLAASLAGQGVSLGAPQIIARTGWTTADLERAMDAGTRQGPYSLVTLLIGVNDQYQGGSAAAYRPAFVHLLARAIALAGGEPQRVIVFSIPDWGVTPFAAGRDRRQIAIEIDRFNVINREETFRAGARYVDITPISRRAATDRTLVAPDGLHPSGAMYRQWVEAGHGEALAAATKSPAAGSPATSTR